MTKLLQRLRDELVRRDYAPSTIRSYIQIVDAFRPDVLHAQGEHFLDQHPWLSVQQRTVLRALRRCRTAALGGHVDPVRHLRTSSHLL